MMAYPFHQRLDNDWEMISAEATDAKGKLISTSSFSTEGWHPCQLPTTVLDALRKIDRVPDPYYGTQLSDAIDDGAFRKPWWFRREFQGWNVGAGSALLHLEGINHRASIWLNGQLLTNSPLKGPFKQWTIDLTSHLNSDTNVLAIEVDGAAPGDYNIGFVDWNPPAPDRSMGVFRPVTLHHVQGVSISHPSVETSFPAEDLHQAQLSLHCVLSNHKKKPVQCVLEAEVLGDIITKKIDLGPHEEKQVILSHRDHPLLVRENPEIWWPYQLGEPRLHSLVLQVFMGEDLSDQLRTKFGIRTVSDYVTPQGHRGFKVNGQPILIKGAGWTDELFLGDTPASIRRQLTYVRHMNINCIRLEGFWGKEQALYDICDEYGILVMVGWSCHWEHEQYLGKEVHPKYGGVTASDDIALIADSWKDQIKWLRHHPSIFVWTVASDMLPHPALERRYIDIFTHYDSSRPYLNSTGGIGSEQGIITSVELISDISGSSRVKMLGPYAYTPPIYWYTNQHLGGAYGFNTETCPGANIPVAESLRKMLPPNHRWPVDEVWEAHGGLNSFATLDRVLQAIEKRYGSFDDLETLAQKAQMLNYELMRPMFEAFQAHHPRSTGVIQWMLNSAWSSTYWQLYDVYLHPTGAFYGAMKACEPLHLIYNYGTHAVMLVNEFSTNVSDHYAEITILDPMGQVLRSYREDLFGQVDFPANIYVLPELPSDLTLFFLDLRLMHGDVLVDKNFYWLSSVVDELDYDAVSEDWSFHTPSKVFADYRDLNHLPRVQIGLRATWKTIEGGQTLLHVDLENKDRHLAFFIYIEILDERTQLSILPIILTDNYISLLPEEQTKLSATLTLEQPISDIMVRISGININSQHVIVRR